MLLTPVSYSQNFSCEEYTDWSNIGGITFFPASNPEAIPAYYFSAPQPLLLRFDELTGENLRYYYTVTHCDIDWSPGDLQHEEFIEGYEEVEVQRWSSSLGTYLNYITNEIQIPNEDMKFRVSGNYMIHVYNEYGEPALSRRFVVVDAQVNVTTEIKRPIKVNLSDEYHRIEPQVDLDKFYVSRPLEEIKITVLQNNRWDNAYIAVPAKRKFGNQLYFDYPDLFLFPALKEFRLLDLRSVEFRKSNIKHLTSGEGQISAELFPEPDRLRKPYILTNDLNGRYFVLNEKSSPLDLSGGEEYLNVTFVLKPVNFSSELTLKAEEDIYVAGGFTNYTVHPRFKMEYDPLTNTYQNTLLLKQGVYDYMYGVGSEVELDFSAIEGSWYETENEYTILVYYRSFGERYDHLIGIHTVHSGQ